MKTPKSTKFFKPTLFISILTLLFNLTTVSVLAQSTQNRLEKLQEKTFSLREKAASKAAELVTRKQELLDKAKAKRDTVKEKIEQKSQEVKTKLDDLRERKATRAAERKERLSEIRLEMIKKYSDKMLARLEAAISRLANIQGRVENRIDKLREEGKDTTILEETLAQAKLKQTAVNTAFMTAKNTLSQLLTQENPQEVFKLSREAVDNVKDALKDWHQALNNIITQIEGVA